MASNGARFRTLARLALILGAVWIAGSAFALAQQSMADYESERSGLLEEWIVISNHYRHSVDCTSDGCVVMGPMSDRRACEEWSAKYNQIDPFDHTRCVSARNYRVRE